MYNKTWKSLVLVGMLIFKIEQCILDHPVVLTEVYNDIHLFSYFAEKYIMGMFKTRGVSNVY